MPNNTFPSDFHLMTAIIVIPIIIFGCILHYIFMIDMDSYIAITFAAYISTCLLILFFNQKIIENIGFLFSVHGQYQKYAVINSILFMLPMLIYGIFYSPGIMMFFFIPYFIFDISVTWVLLNENPNVDEDQ